MNRETLLAELDRLLDLGKPLLTTFTGHDSPHRWWLRLPDNISDEMEWYADEVARREHNRKGDRGHRQQDTTDELAEWVKECEAGLLGWRAIGVLK